MSNIIACELYKIDTEFFLNRVLQHELNINNIHK